LTAKDYRLNFTIKGNDQLTGPLKSAGSSLKGFREKLSELKKTYKDLDTSGLERVLKKGEEGLQKTFKGLRYESKVKDDLDKAIPIYRRWLNLQKSELHARAELSTIERRIEADKRAGRATSKEDMDALLKAKQKAEKAKTDLEKSEAEGLRARASINKYSSSLPSAMARRDEAQKSINRYMGEAKRLQADTASAAERETNLIQERMADKKAEEARLKAEARRRKADELAAIQAKKKAEQDAAEEVRRAERKAERERKDAIKEEKRLKREAQKEAERAQREYLRFEKERMFRGINMAGNMGQFSESLSRTSDRIGGFLDPGFDTTRALSKAEAKLVMGSANKYSADPAERERARAFSDRIFAEAITIGREKGFNPKDILGTYEELGKQGLSVEQIDSNNVRQIADIAKVGEISNEQVVSLVSSIANSYQMDLKTNMGFIGNTLAQLADITQLNMSDLALTYKQVANVAATARVSFQQLTAGVGLLGAVGIKESDAGTALRNMIQKLSDPTDKANEKLQKMGVFTRDSAGNLRDFPTLIREIANGVIEKKLGTGEVTALAKSIVGDDAAAGFTRLLNAATNNSFKVMKDGRELLVNELNHYLTEIEKAGTSDVISDKAKAMTDDYRGSVEKTQAAWQGLSAVLAKQAEDTLKSTNAALTDGITLLTEYAQKNKALGATLGVGSVAVSQGLSAGAAISDIAAPALMLYQFRQMRKFAALQKAVQAGEVVATGAGAAAGGGMFGKLLAGSKGLLARVGIGAAGAGVGTAAGAGIGTAAAGALAAVGGLTGVGFLLAGLGAGGYAIYRYLQDKKEADEAEAIRTGSTSSSAIEAEIIASLRAAQAKASEPTTPTNRNYNVTINLSGFSGSESYDIAAEIDRKLRESLEKADLAERSRLSD
jgi:TP901 family phage tail tape measure protein